MHTSVYHVLQISMSALKATIVTKKKARAKIRLAVIGALARLDSLGTVVHVVVTLIL